MDLAFFATAPRGVERALASELRALGAATVREARGGASFKGPLATGYRACLWSRLATRVLLGLARFPATSADQLYVGVQTVDWRDHLVPDATLAVSFTGTSDTIRDTRFGALKTKDAIVDQLRAATGSRPSVDTRRPDVRVNVHLERGQADLALDLSGESLHRRGYRAERVQVEAPLKENLAAAVLALAGWPAIAERGGSFVDPLCGSGTLPIEAALVAADVAPGLVSRAGDDAFGFLRWRGHDAAAWHAIVEEAAERREAGLARLAALRRPPVFAGWDHDPTAVRIATACVERAGMRGVVTIERRELAALVAPPQAPAGLVACNPPYGERLGERRDLERLYTLLGERLRAEFDGWQFAILSAHPGAARLLGVGRAGPRLTNGPLHCRLIVRGRRDVAREGRSGSATASGTVSPAATGGSAMRLPAASGRAAEHPTTAAGAADARGPGTAPASGTVSPAALDPGAEQFANRLRRDLRHVGRTMRRQGITCYRLYDADLPDYNLAVDVYDGWAHVQEYAPPREVPPELAAARLARAVAIVAETLGIEQGRVVVKQRRRQRGAAQYERRGAGGTLIPVEEDGLTYLVNLTDYLDTGLFLDQRETRRLVRSLAAGRRFLNLFAYTGTTTVSAVAGGALSSVSVDLSRPYLEWALQNFAANKIEGATLERWPASPAAEGARHGAHAAHDDARGARGQRGHPDKPRRPETATRRGAATTRGRHAAPTAAARHRLVQADCLRWIAESGGQFDLIWLDPPTFSNSARMGGATFDVQRDHPDLVRMVARRFLAPDG
ncbi:MAG: bifunctional 23S rRNA (guanine(2069)-N(7))-methyltransferase RlmK/23S rRNA (guanine(2445)-N(2))-methyltransferase RlmL, partial [Thermoleophilia bacterium]|nr:bifunctional 23S rRNA (guanine(2069)-N(7))-methyltransferase RlmK/23S rRNA (guanine(2445)-N(2))-methyltransferase RlmL [Thermoleophilia bacterium]